MSARVLTIIDNHQLASTVYLYTLFIQKFQFSIAGLNGDLYKIIRINQTCAALLTRP